MHRSRRSAPAGCSLPLVVNAKPSLHHRRRASCVLFLHFLSRIESEYLRCCQRPCRRGTKSDLNRRIRTCSSSDVLCRFVSFHWHATCARIVVDIAFVSCVYSHSRCAHPERRKSTCAGLAWLRRIYAQGPIPIDSRRLVKQRRPPARECSRLHSPSRQPTQFLECDDTVKSQ